MSRQPPVELSGERLEVTGKEALRLSQISFASLKARGHGDDVIVRAEIQIGDQDPPDGRRVRYFRMSHSLLTGWRVEAETSALAYYLMLF
jgi:hypothetical protein